MKLASIEYCPTCEQDTMPSHGICLWCDTIIATGLVDPDSAARDKRDRQRASASNAKRYRERRRELQGAERV